MTTILLGVLCLALLFGATIRVIRGAIQASNRALEAQRRQLARETEAAEAAAMTSESEQSHRTTYQPSQPKEAFNIPDKQHISTSTKKEEPEEFDLRKAVIASEILRPKFDE